MPAPVQGGSLDELWSFINVRESDRPLVLAWLVQSLNFSGPYPIICLYGQQGAAKSTTAKLLRLLVDPNNAPLRAESKGTRDLVIAAKGNWCLAFDNLSKVSPELSDALCRLSTGGGFATRQLYTDSNEVVFDYKRPVILNGIEEVVTRLDLLDRGIVLYLPAIPKENRRTEKEFWKAFELVHPRIMGALFDAMAVGLRNLPNTNLASLSRMADFIELAHASEPAWGSVAGQFLPAYEENQQAIQRLPLDLSPIYDPLTKFLAAQGSKTWKGSATELLRRLANLVDSSVRSRSGWPANAQTLAGQLRRLVSSLEAVGILVEFKRSGTRTIHISTNEKFVPFPHGDDKPLISGTLDEHDNKGRSRELQQANAGDTEKNSGRVLMRTAVGTTPRTSGTAATEVGPRHRLPRRLPPR